MPGRGPAPKPESRTRHKPIRGEWKATPGAGWQHGDIPAPPPGLMPTTLLTWDTWMRSWVAANWMPDLLPQINVAIKLYDSFERGEFKNVTELRQWMDSLGLTPKGQQDRRWAPPKADELPAAATDDAPVAASRYAHLRAV
jgi:hypothetical protein